MADTDHAARERFALIFDAHLRAVRAYAVRRVPRQEADDVVSETFLVAWRRIDDVPADALPWLLGVARRVLGEERRAALRRDRLQERMVIEGSIAGGEPGWTEPDGTVLAALAALPARDRELVLLVCWEGLSSADAARIVGCTPTAARVRLHRARRRLGELMAEPPAPMPPVPLKHSEMS